MFNEPKHKVGKLHSVGEVFIDESTIKDIRVFKCNEQMDALMDIKVTSEYPPVYMTTISVGSIVMIVDYRMKTIIHPTAIEVLRDYKNRYYYKSLGSDGTLYWIPEIYLTRLDAQSS
jgi:hypothetical protein